MAQLIEPDTPFSVQVTWPSLPQLGIRSPIKNFLFLTNSATHLWPAASSWLLLESHKHRRRSPKA